MYKDNQKKVATTRSSLFPPVHVIIIMKGETKRMGNDTKSVTIMASQIKDFRGLQE